MTWGQPRFWGSGWGGNKPAGGPPAYNVDAASGWALPDSSSEWTAFNTDKGLVTGNPNFLWRCNETSGNLTPTIGSSFTLTASNGPQYNQSTAFFTRPGVGMTDNTSMGFLASAGVGVDVSTTSVFWLFAVSIRTEPTALRIFAGINPGGGSNQCRVLWNPTAGTNRLQGQWAGGGSTIASIDHGNGKYLIAIKTDYAHSGGAVYSQLAQATTLFSFITGDQQKGFGGVLATDSVIHWSAMWTGSAAEAFDDNKVAALYTAMGATPAWSGYSVDATSGKAAPASATEWTSLICGEVNGNQGNPVWLYLMQEASGNLTDTINSNTFNGANTRSYREAITGWSRLAVGTTDGGTGGGSWGTASSLSVVSSSLAMMGFIRIDGATAERQIMALGASVSPNDVALSVTAGGLLKVDCAGNTTTGSVNYEGGSVTPILLVYDRTNSRCHVYTDQEKITVTYGAVTGSDTKRYGGTNTATAKYLYGAVWFAAAAERLSTDANSKALIQGLGWPVTGY